MASKSISITLAPHSNPEKRSTKNTYRFEEIVESEFAAEQLGGLYVPKTTLGTLGYAEGKGVKVTIEVVDVDAS